MKYRTRIYYTETDKALMWDRWQKGDSLQTIAQLLNRNHSSIAVLFIKNWWNIESRVLYILYLKRDSRFQNLAKYEIQAKRH